MNKLEKIDFEIDALEYEISIAKKRLIELYAQKKELFPGVSIMEMVQGILESKDKLKKLIS